MTVSEDRQQWDRRTRIGLADIAVSPDDPDELLATTEDGPARSTDGGKSFATVKGAPTLVFIDRPTSDRLVGVDPGGAVHVSADAGKSWSEQGTVSGGPQAILAHGHSEMYLATEQAIYHSTDNGNSFTEYQSLS